MKNILYILLIINIVILVLMTTPKNTFLATYMVNTCKSPEDKFRAVQEFVYRFPQKKIIIEIDKRAKPGWESFTFRDGE